MTQTNRIFEKFGGPQVVAEILGITVPRARRWNFPEARGGNDGHVPAKHYKALLEAAQARGVDLTPEDLLGAQ